jgi:hypothetical protein
VNPLVPQHVRRVHGRVAAAPAPERGARRHGRPAPPNLTAPSIPWSYGLLVATDEKNKTKAELNQTRLTFPWKFVRTETDFMSGKSNLGDWGHRL